VNVTKPKRGEGHVKASLALYLPQQNNNIGAIEATKKC